MFQDLSIIPEIPASKSNLDPLFQAAEVLFQHKDYDSLKNIAANILQRDSKQARAIFYLSKYFEKNQSFANQEKCLEKLLQIELNPTYLFEYANFLYSRNRFDEAIQVIQDNINQITTDDSSEFFDLYRLMGNISLRSGDLATAEEYYNICLRINSASDQIYSNLGSLFLHSGNISRALGYYKNALDHNQQNAKAWFGIALCHLSQKDSQLFWGSIKTAFEADKNDPKIVQVALDQALSDFEYEDALVMAQSYLRTYPFDLNISVRFASLLYQVGDFTKAKLELVKILSFDPNNEDALKILGLLGAENG